MDRIAGWCDQRVGIHFAFKSSTLEYLRGYDDCSIERQ